MLYNFAKKKINFDYVLKLHTKSDNYWRCQLTNIFMNNNIDSCINLLDKNQNIYEIGKINYVVKNNNFCNKIIAEMYPNNHNINNYYFVAGTIFLCRKQVFDKVIEKIEKYEYALYVISFYYNNVLFKDYSIIHAIERLFVFVVYEMNKNIHKL